ncbi:MAG TPA: hypothetical protein VMW68_10685 [Methyloceanibacter sp.]|nr:hypothetical protein [Methyloceanibacter sp.]
MTKRTLPEGFQDLARFVEKWARPLERERYNALLDTTIDELREFYDTMLPRMQAIEAYLDPFGLDGMPDEARTLFDLAMTFMETAHPIDLGWRTTDIEDSFPADRFEILPVDAP